MTRAWQNVVDDIICHQLCEANLHNHGLLDDQVQTVDRSSIALVSMILLVMNEYFTNPKPPKKLINVTVLSWIDVIIIWFVVISFTSDFH
jgi:hypothetical protein